ncbi:unnamed protein product, partial [Coregonus sp. 'balchen']
THHHGNWCHDVRDILELAGGDNDGLISKKDFINSDKYTDHHLSLSRDAPPLLPSDTTQGYRTVKVKLGCKWVRPWKWMPSANTAR